MKKKNEPFTVAILPGDGIGPEVMAEAEKVLRVIGEKFALDWRGEHGWIGGSAIDRCGSPLPEETVSLCRRADAVLLGSIGGPRWDNLPAKQRPEIGGLLALRQKLGLYANIRPVTVYRSLRSVSPLAWRDEMPEPDLVTVRELAGGLYFSEPRFLDDDEALDSLRYRRPEIERIARVAFSLARQRRNLVTSVDKANVLCSSMLWRRVVKEVAREYAEVELRHMYVDNAAMQLILRPSQFDVILTENLFGDILSDESAALCGSLGLLPSASLGASVHLYEPAGGSAPDIAGQGIANPIAQILSVALMLEISFQKNEAAAAIRRAVQKVLDQGFRTADLAAPGSAVVATAQLGDLVAAELEEKVD